MSLSTFPSFFVWLLVLFGLWFLSLTWVWFKMGKSENVPIQNLPRALHEGRIATYCNQPAGCIVGGTWLILYHFTWIYNNGTTVCFRKSFPRGPLIFFAVFMPAALCVGAFVIASRHTIQRWSVGLASFISTLSLALYCLLPLITAGFLMNDANRVLSSIQQGDKQFAEASLLALVFVLVIVASALFSYKVVSAARGIAGNIDYCRSHPEVQVEARSGKNWLLTIAVMPMCLFTGVLATLSFLNCAVFLQSVLLGSHRWLVSSIFENAVMFFNVMLGIIFSALGIKYAIFWPGKIALILFSLPIIAWGFVQVWFALKEISQHFSFWKCCRNTPLGRNGKLKDAVGSVAGFAHLSPPRVRIDPSNIIYAYVAISPLPFLPRIMVLSDGTLTKLPWRCVQALVAHEFATSNAAIPEFTRF